MHEINSGTWNKRGLCFLRFYSLVVFRGEVDESEAYFVGGLRGTYWWIGCGRFERKEDSRLTGRDGGYLLDLARICEFCFSLGFYVSERWYTNFLKVKWFTSWCRFEMNFQGRNLDVWGQNLTFQFISFCTFWISYCFCILLTNKMYLKMTFLW